MSKAENRMAIFIADFKTPAETITPGKITQGKLIVGFPRGKKTMSHWLIQDRDSSHILFQTKTDRVNAIDPPVDDPKIVELLGETPAVSPFRIDTKDITIRAKIDRYILPTLTHVLAPMAMTTSALDNSAVTLRSYIEKFNIAEDADLSDGVSPSTSAPFLFGRREIDGLRFFNSPTLSLEEKAAATAHVPLHLLRVVWNLPSFQYALRQITTRHGRPWVAIGLHGVAGGGKSLIAQALAMLLGIGFDQHTGSPQLSMADIWGKTLPVATKPLIDPNDPKARHALEVLEQAYCLLKETGGTPQELDDALARWAHLRKAMEPEVNLVRVETTALKAAKYDLPCIVNIDELDLCNGMLLNELFATITSGTYRDGVTTGQNHGTLFWVFSWNPNTAGARAFDQKVFDRLGMISVPSMEAKIIDNAQNEALLQESELESQPLDFSVADAIIDAAPLDEAHREALRANVHAQFGTAEDLAWFAQQRINLMAPPAKVSVVDGAFISVHRGQMPEDPKAVALTKLNAIDTFAETINSYLKDATRGQDKKNPDRSAAYYIPTRAKALFKDMILSYRDVRKGTEEFIFNLLPGCNVLSTDTKVDPAADVTPRRIAVSICETLADQINELQNQLFMAIDKTTVEAAQAAWLSTTYDPSLWVVPNTGDMIANPEIIGEASSGSNTDELDALLTQ